MKGVKKYKQKTGYAMKAKTGAERMSKTTIRTNWEIKRKESKESRNKEKGWKYAKIG